MNKEQLRELADTLFFTKGRAIQRNGDGAWFCLIGSCGGVADNLEDLKHSESCPFRDLVRTVD